MPIPNQLPASLRYFKARLRPLAQPPVWVPAIFISAVGLVASEYWLNPLGSSLQKKEFAESNNPAYSFLSREDSRIGADIDSLPVLFHDFDRSITSAAPVAPNKKTQATNTKRSFEDLLAQKPATFPADTQSTPITGTSTPDSAGPKLENPFLVQAQKLLQAGSFDSRGTSLAVNPYTASSSQPVIGQTSGSSFGLQLPNGTNQNQSVAPISPLQPALNQSAIANPTATTYPQAPTNALGQSLPTSVLPSKISPATTQASAGTGYNSPGATNTSPAPNSYINLVGTQPVSGVVSAAQVAPPVTSVAPTNITPYSVQVPTQATGSNTNPGLNSNFGNSGLQPSQLQQRN